MDVPTDASPVLFDEAGVIIADTACRRCGYNLRGLHQDSRCPECGTPIGLSTHGDLLRFSDPEWVEKLALGIKYIIWAVVISIALGAAAGCLTGALGASPVFLQGVMVLGGLLGVYGAWLLTAPDPSRIGEDRYITARDYYKKSRNTSDENEREAFYGKYNDYLVETELWGWLYVGFMALAAMDAYVDAHLSDWDVENLPKDKNAPEDIGKAKSSNSPDWDLVLGILRDGTPSLSVSISPF